MGKHHDKWPEHHQDVMTSILGVLPHLKLQEVRHDQPSQIEAFLKLDILSTVQALLFFSLWAIAAFFDQLQSQ